MKLVTTNSPNLKMARLAALRAEVIDLKRTATTYDISGATRWDSGRFNTVQLPLTMKIVRDADRISLLLKQLEQSPMTQRQGE